MKTPLLGATAVAGLIACGDTGLREVHYPIVGFGITPEQATFAAGEWQVTLTVAEVAIGPIYFCATAAASSDLCPAAVNEFAAFGVVDALDPSLQALGMIDGSTGEIRSATWDYGIPWFDTQAVPTPAAEAPGGHSAHFEGTATKGLATLAFVADLDVVPRYQGTLAVQGTRVTASIAGSDLRLEVAFDPAAWWQDVDFDDVFARVADQPADVATPVDVGAIPRALNALVIAMTATAPPTFRWVVPPASP